MTSIDQLSRWCFVRAPAAAARLGPGPLLTIGDGHWLTALGPVAPILTLLSGVAGLIVGWRHLGFDVAITESTGLVVAPLALGVLGTQFSTSFLAGFVFGDFFLAHSSWWTSAPGDYSGSWEEVGLLANLWYERVPLLSHYVLIGALLVGIPVGARALVSQLAQRARGPLWLQLFVGAVLNAVALFVLVRFWTAASPHVVRPLFTWAPPWIRTSPPPLAAIAPVQNNPTIPRLGAGVVVARFAIIALFDMVPGFRRRVEAVEIACGSEILDLGPRPPRSRLAAIGVAALGSIVGLLFLTGLIERLTTALALGLAFFVLRLAKLGVIPIPTQRWREVVNRVPLTIRFGAVLLIVNGIARMVVGTSLSGRDGFEFLLWPMVPALAVMTLLLPDLIPRAGPRLLPPAPADRNGSRR